MKNPKLIIENPYFLCAINYIKACIDKDKQKTVEIYSKTKKQK